MQAPFLYQVSPSRIHWFTLTTNFVGTSLPSSTQDRLVSKVPPRLEVPKTSPHTVPREPGARVTGVEASCDSAWILASSAKTRSMYLVLPTDAPQWLVHNPVHTIAEKQWDKVSPALLSCWWKRSWTCSPNPTLSVSEYGPVSKPVVLAGIPQSCRRFQSTSQCTESNAFLRSTQAASILCRNTYWCSASTQSARIQSVVKLLIVNPDCSGISNRLTGTPSSTIPQ